MVEREPFPGGATLSLPPGRGFHYRSLPPLSFACPICLLLWGGERGDSEEVVGHCLLRRGGSPTCLQTLAGRGLFGALPEGVFDIRAFKPSSDLRTAGHCLPISLGALGTGRPQTPEATDHLEGRLGPRHEDITLGQCF